jgi:uncharacterized damage-inducible protein DinB
MATAHQSPTPEFAVGYREMMLQSFSNEVQTTKKVISAIPENKRDYRPDPHARTAWELAWHLANSDIQFLDGIADLKFTMQTPEPKDKPKTISELLSWYEQNYNRAAARVRALTPQQLLTSIDFAGIFKFPAFVYLAFLNNHSVHHRGALATYLRPMGAKVPSIYGGSYDEPFEAAA